MARCPPPDPSADPGFPSGEAAGRWVLFPKPAPAPHTLRPASAALSHLGSWCGRTFATRWSERVPGPRSRPHSSSEAWRPGLCLTYTLLSQALLPPSPWQVAQHGWPTVDLWFKPGRVRQGRAQAVVPLAMPWAPPDFLVAGLEAPKELPSHPVWRTSLGAENGTSLTQKSPRQDKQGSLQTVSSSQSDFSRYFQTSTQLERG